MTPAPAPVEPLQASARAKRRKSKPAEPNMTIADAPPSAAVSVAAPPPAPAAPEVPAVGTVEPRVDAASDAPVQLRPKHATRLAREAPLVRFRRIGAAVVAANARVKAAAHAPRVACVVVHGADRLRPQRDLLHPAVRVSFIDGDTGLPLRKQPPPGAPADAPVPDMSIQPGTTQAFDLCAHNTLQPAWQENVLFSDDLAHILAHRAAVALFEILDYASITPTWTGFSGAGEVLVAWAFLRLHGLRGARNVHTRLRLQLYASEPEPEPRARGLLGRLLGRRGSAQQRAHHPNAYGLDVSTVASWFLERDRARYDGSLYVTVKDVPGQPTYADNTVHMRPKAPV